jgi:myo-inositol-1(or 4)-monophosphatase
MLEAVIHTVKRVAQHEIVPRYLRVAHQHKVDGSLCTIADTAAQAALVESLRAIAPCPVLGEEMGAAEQQNLWQAGDEGLWVIDPIDGTSNFVNGLPYFAVSVAFWRGERPRLGVIYAPELDEMFWAVEGQGAFLNGERLPIKEKPPRNLRAALAGVDLKRLDRRLAEELAARPPYRSQRNFGSSALDWCFVAAGRFDVYLHGGQKLWDFAAGALILEEAGGRLATLQVDDFWSASPWKRSVIAAWHPPLFEAWRDWLRAPR